LVPKLRRWTLVKEGGREQMSWWLQAEKASALIPQRRREGALIAQ
jgi:hypothetical protein